MTWWWWQTVNSRYISPCFPVLSQTMVSLSFRPPFSILPGAPEEAGKVPWPPRLHTSWPCCRSQVLPGFSCDLPASGELHVGIKEAGDLASGHLPALNTSSYQSLSFLVSHHLHQPRVAFVDILLQGGLQLLCKWQNTGSSINMSNVHPTHREANGSSDSSEAAEKSAC